MKIPSQDILVKFHESPGHCTLAEIKEISQWMLNFQIHLLAYREVFGEPVGFSTHSILEKLSWYEEYHSKF